MGMLLGGPALLIDGAGLVGGAGLVDDAGFERSLRSPERGPSFGDGRGQKRINVLGDIVSEFVLPKAAISSEAWCEGQPTTGSPPPLLRLPLRLPIRRDRASGRSSIV